MKRKGRGWMGLVVAVAAGIALHVVLAGAVAHPAPVIAVMPDGQMFRVTFEPGAVAACTVYQQQTLSPPNVHWPDGHYTPRHCGTLQEQMGAYEDDWAFIKAEQTPWRVWSEVQYPDGPPRADGVQDAFVTVKSNVVEVTR